MYRVLKFGGSSVADATHMSQVLDIVEAETSLGQVVLVASAISGATDALLGGVGLEELEERHMRIIRRLFTGAEREEASDEIRRLFCEMKAAPVEERVTFGEIFSTRILVRKLLTDGMSAEWLDSRKLIIKGSRETTVRNIRSAVCDVQVMVAPGFICGTRKAAEEERLSETPQGNKRDKSTVKSRSGI